MKLPQVSYAQNSELFDVKENSYNNPEIKKVVLENGKILALILSSYTKEIPHLISQDKEGNSIIRLEKKFVFIKSGETAPAEFKINKEKITHFNCISLFPDGAIKVSVDGKNVIFPKGNTKKPMTFRIIGKEISKFDGVQQIPNKNWILWVGDNHYKFPVK